MEFIIRDFEGPLDLLLHLIKKADIDIYDIKIEEVTNQYLKYIKDMEELDLNIASEYLVMAAELIEIKSRMLLPSNKHELEDDYEENPREILINKLIEYKKYKEATNDFKNLENTRQFIHTKTPESLKQYANKDIKVVLDKELDLNDLMNAFNEFLKRKNMEKPLNTKITKKELSVTKRTVAIRSILKKKKKVAFEDLFEIITKEYVVVTFLSILNMAKNKEISITQNQNFKKIYISSKEGDKSE